MRWPSPTCRRSNAVTRASISRKCCTRRLHRFPWPKNLVPRKHIKVAVEGLRVHRHVGDCLRAVSTRAVTVRDLDPLTRGSDRAESIRYLAESNDAGTRAKQLLVFLQNHFPRSFTRATRRRAPFSKQSICQGTISAWYRSQVSLAALANVATPPALCNKSDTLRRTLGPRAHGPRDEYIGSTFPLP